MLIRINRAPFQIASDHQPSRVVVVVSHERSGTHFLMNSIAMNSAHVVDPFLNFDHSPQSDEINFYSRTSVGGFFGGLLQMKVPAGRLFLKSIVKSHHAHPFLAPVFGMPGVRVVYVHRDPVDTMVSLWRFLHRWEWHEGRKAATPLELSRSPPEGRLVRYQYHHAATHFDRWAQHVSGWLEVGAREDNVMCVSYADLCADFEGRMSEILRFVEQPLPTVIRPPPRGAYIEGRELDLSSEDRAALILHVETELSRYPMLGDHHGARRGRRGPVSTGA